MQLTENTELLTRAARNQKAGLKPYGLEHKEPANDCFPELNKKAKEQCIKYGFITKKMLRGH